MRSSVVGCLRDNLREPSFEALMRSHLNHGSSDAGSEEDSDAVDEEDAGDGGDDDEPEPEEDVDLLIDDVEGQHAQAVMSLRGPARPELVEAALGHLGIIIIYITIITSSSI